ncbi:MAG: class I SAM-dependent methyltransferase [Planctomycetes bacterium]|nr:class I SAM-dependent methyltransferase [Planctomycetota bacterium]
MALTPLSRTRATARFYDGYWPVHVPDPERTRDHVLCLIPPGRYRRALDGGCGTGVCTQALATLAEEVHGVDVSPASLETARRLAHQRGVEGIRFREASLLALPYPDGHFDLCLSWGVVHHTADPLGALDELVRVLAPGGTLVLAVYLRTALTPVHEAVRRLCRRLPRAGARAVVEAAALAVRLSDLFRRSRPVRDDVADPRSQVEDWYLVPEKHFFTPREMEDLFRERGLGFELLYPRTGRFASTSNFICRGRRP